MTKQAALNQRLWILIPLLIVLVLVAFWVRNLEFPPLAEATAASSIHYLGPDEYYLNRGAYIQEPSGETRMDSVLLPLIPDSIEGEAANDGGYIGPSACAECHRDNYEGFLQTAHARTSAVPSAESIRGSFEAGENVLETASPNLRIEMLKQDDRFVQRMILTAHGQAQGGDFPFDIVTGSGRVGQTYLYFQGEHLYQLHASYLSSTDTWMNSPGYLDGVADFARPILSACLECHTTYYQPYEGAANQYHREHYVLGVTCEKCHGPGKEHVLYHRQNPEATQAHAIVNPGTISAERSMELCQLCHGGDPIREIQPPFSYRPGEPLEEYYEFPESDGSQLSTGVHTNTQLPRLRRSACFQESEAMTCVDCHNPHQHERGDRRLFSERCMNCHQPPECGKFKLLGEKLSENCIDCHMLSVEMSDIKLNAKGKRFVPKMRDHFIRVWPEASDEFLKGLEAATQEP